MTIVTSGIVDVDNVASLVASGGWVLLDTQTASASATIDVTGLHGTKFYMIKFIWYGLQAASDQLLWMRTSSDNGTSWDSGTSDYAWSNHEVSMATSPAHDPDGDDADAQIVVSGSVIGSAANELSDYEITCFNPTGPEHTKFKWEGTRIDGTGVGFHDVGAGVRAETISVNGVRFLMASGNISTGILKTYGVMA